MKSFLTISVAAATMTLGLMAQKLETQKPDSTKVLRVETAKDHLTVIELSDAVTMVAVGNRSAFTVERRENKVFVTPADDGARTNLFIWTTGGRPVQLAVPKVSEGMVEIDDEGRCFLVEQVEGEDGQTYTKATFLMAVTRDGQVVFDGGRVQWVHPFPYSAGAGEIRNGKLEVPGSRQIPWVASPAKPIR